MRNQDVKLLNYLLSPVGRRVEWALKLKGVEYDYIEEDIFNKSSLLLEMNPVHKKVPVLVHGHKSIAESLIILDYIDETWKQYPLLPPDPYQRSQARFWAKLSDEKHFGFLDVQFFSINCAYEWIKGNAIGPSAHIFLACLWWTWRHRNNMCINNDTWPLMRLSCNIHNSANIIQQAFQTAPSACSDRWISWNSSNFNCHILNVDGSCLGTPLRAGYGGLIRNNAGLFLNGFSGHIHGSSCILLAELTAIHKGLSLAVDMGIEVLVCFSDSQLSVNLITGSVSKFHTYAVLIQDIKDLLSSRNFRIFHTLREGNQCTDFLAKLGASSNDTYSVHQSPPLDLISLLRSDAMGTLFLRT